MGIIRNKRSYEVYMGVDIGQTVDPTSIVIVDPEVRDKVIHYPVRFLKRLPLGISYPSIIEEIKRIYSNIPKPEPELNRKKVRLERHLWIDSTGVGKPVTDLLIDKIPELWRNDGLHSVYITGGEARGEIYPDVWEIRVPKAYLVSRLQVLISCGRIHLPSVNPEAQAMKNELMNYTIRVNENANTEFGAFRVGTHDDLVTALALACLCEGMPEPARVEAEVIR